MLWRIVEHIRISEKLNRYLSRPDIYSQTAWLLFGPRGCSAGADHCGFIYALINYINMITRGTT